VAVWGRPCRGCSRDCRYLKRLEHVLRGAASKGVRVPLWARLSEGATPKGSARPTHTSTAAPADAARPQPTC
jgi:hypothetical protein